MTAQQSLSAIVHAVPITIPNQHTPEEIKLIQDMRRRNPHSGLVVFWVKLMRRGYKRSSQKIVSFSEETRESWLKTSRSQIYSEAL